MTVELKVAGQIYRLASSASEDELRGLAADIDAKVASLIPKGKKTPPNALLLAALALANDLREERARRLDTEGRARDLLRRVLVRVDRALEEGTESIEAAVEAPRKGNASPSTSTPHEA
jgi:cell division protein ZapA